MINFRECNYYRWGKNVDKKEVKKFYLHFAKSILSRNPILIKELFDNPIYSTAYKIPGQELIDIKELDLHFTKFLKMKDRQLIQLLENNKLNENEKFFLGLYLKFLSRQEWNCFNFNMKFKSFYYSIKNKVNCGIEVDKGKSDSYMLRIIYKNDVYDMSLTKDLKIKGIQCTALFYEGY